MKKRDLEYHEDGTLSTVRTNLMNQPRYAPYCGSVFPGHPNYTICSSPRVVWNKELSQFKCPSCGWVSEFPETFITKYKKKWGL